MELIGAEEVQRERCLSGLNLSFYDHFMGAIG